MYKLKLEIITRRYNLGMAQPMSTSGINACKTYAIRDMSVDYV